MDREAELKKIHRLIKKCTKCRLSKARSNAVPGEGPIGARYMFIGQGPGKKEDLTGQPFVGKAGKFLDELLKKNRIDRKKVFITSTVKCLAPENRLPKKDEITACLPYTLRQIKLVEPKFIILLGRVAMKAFTPFKDLDKYHGKTIKVAKKAYFLTYHPASGMRFPAVKKKMKKDFKKIKEL
ncbi:uracil-DNA glycosylase [Candidatus Woesearchaeota archaeon]|nr:uracil-DNA glycosylase [Candidatus Woesearchaeota archaeon]